MLPRATLGTIFLVHVIAIVGSSDAQRHVPGKTLPKGEIFDDSQQFAFHKRQPDVSTLVPPPRRLMAAGIVASSMLGLIVGCRYWASNRLSLSSPSSAKSVIHESCGHRVFRISGVENSGLRWPSVVLVSALSIVLCGVTGIAGTLVFLRPDNLVSLGTHSFILATLSITAFIGMAGGSAIVAAAVWQLTSLQYGRSTCDVMAARSDAGDVLSFTIRTSNGETPSGPLIATICGREVGSSLNEPDDSGEYWRDRLLVQPESIITEDDGCRIQFSALVPSNIEASGSSSHIPSVFRSSVSWYVTIEAANRRKGVFRVFHIPAFQELLYEVSKETNYLIDGHGLIPVRNELASSTVAKWECVAIAQSEACKVATSFTLRPKNLFWTVVFGLASLVLAGLTWQGVFPVHFVTLFFCGWLGLVSLLNFLACFFSQNSPRSVIADSTGIRVDRPLRKTIHIPVAEIRSLCVSAIHTPDNDLWYEIQLRSDKRNPQATTLFTNLKFAGCAVHICELFREHFARDVPIAFDDKFVWMPRA